jgi:electron transfer flavoprotein alpha subunit
MVSTRMASIVAYIELRDGAITRSSLFAIGESRRIAQAAGATVYGFLALGPLSPVEIDRLAEQVSAAGADRILCSSDETLGGPALDVFHGAVLAQLADHLRPVLFIFPSGGVGAELGPPLAIRIGAAYVPAASLEIHPVDSGQASVSNRILLTRWRAGRDSLRRIDVGDFERPVVAVLAAGSGSECQGESYAEAETIPCPPPKHAALRVLRIEADPSAEIESCQTLLCVPATTSALERDDLRAALPPDACLRTEGDGDLETAAPQHLLALSLDPGRLPIRARAFWELSGTIGDLIAALHRVRGPGGGAPA